MIVGIGDREGHPIRLVVPRIRFSPIPNKRGNGVWLYVNHNHIFSQVKQAYEATGETVQEIAARLGMHYTTIHKWARKYEWNRRGEKQIVVQDHNLDRLRKAYETDFSQEVPYIATQFGVSDETVRRYARMFGWVRRHNSTYHKTATHKQCMTCGEWLPKNEFRNGGVCELCKRGKKYGITRAEILSMYNEQDGRCAVCGVSFGDVKWCIDHDHNSGVVRGILCDKCNTSAGLLNDDPERIERLARYVRARGAKRS